MTIARIGVISAALTASALMMGCGGEPAMRSNPHTLHMDARNVLLQAAESPQPVIRMHALEALAQTEGPLAAGTLMQALDDPNPAVQFAAAMAIGDIRHAGARERLLEKMASPQTNPNVHCAIIYALYRLGDNSYISLLGTYLFHGTPEIRGNAALAMGKMGDPSAIRPLRSVLSDKTNPGLQLQALESLAALGDDRSIDLLAAYARTHYLDERMVAVQALGRARSERSKPIMLSAMGSNQPPQLRMVAVAALARTGDYRGYDLAVRGVRQPDELIRGFYGRDIVVQDALRSQVQVLAILAMGYMNNPTTVDVLAPMLSNPDGAARVAAAKSILQLLEGSRPAAAARAEYSAPKTVEAASPDEQVAPPARLLEVAPAKD